MSDTRTAALPGYLQYCNRRRPRASLGRRSPWTRFQEAACMNNVFDIHT